MTCISPAPVVLADLLDIVELALATITRRLPAHVGRDDLASVGKLALITTTAYFTGSPDEVRAYCFVRVRGAMLDELRRLDPLSRNRRAQVNTVRRAQALLTARFGRVPTRDELATTTQLSAIEVSSAQAALAAESERMDVEWNSLPDTETPSPAESVEVADLNTGMRAALDRLPSNQALALRRYYLEDATLDDIAAELGVSRERARQVREAGEKKLRADFIVLALWQSFITSSRE
jgi:RNA polymerase sigma factor for flagellar operon FliA